MFSISSRKNQEIVLRVKIMKTISWLKKKKNKILTLLIFLVFFLLSLDFWGWNNSNPRFLGLPIWIFYFIILTFMLSIFYYIISKNIWEER